MKNPQLIQEMRTLESEISEKEKEWREGRRSDEMGWDGTRKTKSQRQKETQKSTNSCYLWRTVRGGLGSPGLENPNPQPAHLAQVWAFLTRIFSFGPPILVWVGLDWVVGLDGFLYRPTHSQVI